MRDTEYMHWISRMPCCVCVPGQAEFAEHFDVAMRDRKSDPAHTRNNGMSSKGSDSSCVPLCRYHHGKYDSGRKEFEQLHEIDMQKQAGEWYAAYLRKSING